MATLPDVTSLGARPIPSSNRPIAQDRSGIIIADAALDVAASIGDFATRMQAREDQFNYSKAKHSLLMADAEVRRELENDQDWQTHETRYRNRMKKASEVATAMIKSPNDKALFGMDSGLDIERGAEAIATGARRIQVDSARATLDEMGAANRTAALELDEASATALIQNQNDALDAAVKEGFLTAQEATDRKQGWVVDYALGRLETMEPAERIEALQNPKGNAARFLDADVRTRLLRNAQAEIETNDTEVRQALGDQLKDIGVAAKNGLPIVNIPDKSVLQSAFGEYQGAQLHEAALAAQELSNDVAGMHALSNDELIAQASGYAPTQVEGAAEQDEVARFMAGSTVDILRERAADPSGYLVQHSPAVREEWAKFEADPEASPDAYLRALRAERERFGMSGEDVVPKAYAASIADQVNSAKAEDLASTFEMLGQKWGAAYPALYAQISEDVPSSALVVGSGIPRADAVALSSMVGLKDTELRGMLTGGTTWNDLEREVGERFSEFQASFPVDAARTTGAVKDAATRLAIKYMNDGSGLGDAVEKAHRALVDSQYSLLDMRGVTIRVPLGVDPKHVESVAEASLAKFRDPTSLVGLDGLAPPEDELSRWYDYVQDNGYWLTNPSGTGIRLHVDGGPVGFVDHPIEMTWDEIESAAIAADDERRKRLEQSTRQYRIDPEVGPVAIPRDPYTTGEGF